MSGIPKLEWIPKDYQLADIVTKKPLTKVDYYGAESNNLVQKGDKVQLIGQEDLWY